ncbi:MAG: hypothetical protein AAB975_04775 [Patescibacteria group bacterium]
MPAEIIDLRKQSSLMKAVRTPSQVSLAVPGDMRASDTRISAFPPAVSSVQLSDVHITTDPPVGNDAPSEDDINTSAAQEDPGFDLEWSSYEHEHRIRGPYWFLYPLTIATAGIAFGITTRSYLFVAFVVIAFLMLTYYAKRPPRTLAYAIEKRGVWMGDKLFDYSRIKSFWIFSHALMAPELLLETASPINPVIHVRLEGIDPDAVKYAISRYLPEKEQKDLISRQITRIIGF